MVADGAHILLSMALVYLLLRERRPEPYFVAVLAASIPDADKFVFTPLVRLGYLDGVVWFHRGVMHSLLFGAILVAVLSLFGSRRAAIIGVVSHLCLDFLTGGVRLLVPLDNGLYGLEIGWLLTNVAAMVVAATILFAGLVDRRYRSRIRSALARLALREQRE
ncbi:metal-dependent hydrolase [Halorientalis regularis]|jgi:inner membrane protein|uniref:Inner membrane protein n=1 Tax=Halorientalis regularis TaxID=660518 RepID=A0A1G7GIX7_9EURY|nr:metal-dependent hydrolase [Halorientalis regularis]SDE88070.1 inner membrane protein [Halorientalis regularis]